MRHVIASGYAVEVHFLGIYRIAALEHGRSKTADYVAAKLRVPALGTFVPSTMTA
jgi:hypothetical protein